MRYCNAARELSGSCLNLSIQVGKDSAIKVKLVIDNSQQCCLGSSCRADYDYEAIWEAGMNQFGGKNLWLLIVLLLCSGAASAQFSSAIEGSVTDSSGAVIPGAKVVLTGTATGVTSTTEANG